MLFQLKGAFRFGEGGRRVLFVINISHLKNEVFVKNRSKLRYVREIKGHGHR